MKTVNWIPLLLKQILEDWSEGLSTVEGLIFNWEIWRLIEGDLCKRQLLLETEQNLFFAKYLKPQQDISRQEVERKLLNVWDMI